MNTTTLVNELKKIGTQDKGIQVAIDIFNYLTMAENMDDNVAIRKIASLFVERNMDGINKLHTQARAKFVHLNNRY